VSASTVLGAALLLAAAALVSVGLLGWSQRLPRNRFAGVRTPATLRSDAAFTAANRVAAPPVLAAGAICAVAAALAFGTGGAALVVVVAVAGAGAVGLLIAGGLLGHRVAAEIPAPATGCAGCACGGGGCSAGQPEPQDQSQIQG
jgi:uncharacterized membrane protein